MFETVATRRPFFITLYKTKRQSCDMQWHPTRQLSEESLTFTLRFLQVLHPVLDLVCFWIEERGGFLTPAELTGFGDLDESRADDSGDACEGEADMMIVTTAAASPVKCTRSVAAGLLQRGARPEMRRSPNRLAYSHSYT